MAGSDLFTGSIDLLVLKAVSWGPLHGYAIGRWIRDSTSGSLLVKDGVLYPVLHRLEQRGFLEEEWGLTETNREAKFYRLTSAGRKQLKAELARWQDYSRIMTAVLDAAKP
jgi:PadR family transcriptional regulator PadR